MFRYVRWMALLSGLTAAPVLGATALQCVPYARIVSGVEIYGDALTWWDQAQDHYKRGSIPKKGAVLAFRPVGPMTLGHVAVVSRILDDRRVLIRHANWSSPGAIEEDVLAIDVSDAGDWSQVRVWHSPTGQMGARTNPTFGFIYPAKAKLHPFTPDPALGSSLRYASAAADNRWDDEDEDDAAIPAPRPAPRLAMQTRAMAASLSPKPRLSERKVPRLEMDPFIIEYADNSPSNRSLREVIADVKRDSRMN
ncbi:CHAP domain-containing protein [Sphingobium yanoikuyae]|uniref:CHAP domain-containing protein n=1 Tax=Sphingobium yanoikuyae TaxID=13690 RepID=UPI00345E8DC2